MILLILSIFILVLCSGGALMECKIMDRLCNRLFEDIRGGVEYEEDNTCVPEKNSIYSRR